MIDAMLFLSALDDPLGCLAPVSNVAPPPMCPTGPCALCSAPIADKSFLLIGDRSWHEQCARCAVCNENLENQASCFLRNETLLCKRDYVERFWRRCPRCNSLIQPTDLVITVRDNYFHSSCFACVICGQNMKKGDTVVLGEGNLLFYHYDVNADLPFSQTPAVHFEESQSPKSDISHRSRPNRKQSPFDVADAENSDHQISKTKRMRTSFKHHQLRTMKTYFNLNHNPDARDLGVLAQKTGLTKRVLQVWFQNARAKYRRSQQSRNSLSSPTHSNSIDSEVTNSNDYHSAGSESPIPKVNTILHPQHNSRSG